MSNPYSRIRRAKRRRETSRPEDTSHAILPPGPCETCGGTGTVEDALDEPPFDDVYGTCPDCDGSGVSKMQEG